MRFSRAALVLGLLSFLVASPAAAVDGVFQPLDLWGGQARSLALDPSHEGRVYAATFSGGVYRSDDGGVNWTRTATGLPLDPSTHGYQPVVEISVDPADGRVYALGTENLFVSDDGGATWGMIPRPAGAKRGLKKLVVDPSDGQKLYASNGPLGSGVLVSADRGATWSLANDGLVSTQIHDLESAGGGTCYAIAGNALYKSFGPAEMPWYFVSNLPAGKVRDLGVAPGTTDRLYLALDSGCFRSDNGGGAWVPVDAGLEADIYGFVVGEARVLALGRGNLYSMPLGGTLTEGFRFPHTRFRAGAVLPDGSVVAATDMGVFRGPSGVFANAATLALSARGMRNADVNSVAAARGSEVIYVGTGQSYDGGVFRSPDGGQTWEHRSLGITNPDIRSLAVAATDPQVVYVGTADATDDFGVNGQIFRTRDGGQTWVNVSDNLPHEDSRIIISLAVDIQDPDIVYAGVQAYAGGIYKSLNGGETWFRASAGLQSMPEMPGFEDNPFINYYVMLSIGQHPTDRDRIWLGAGGCWGGVYITDDGGVSWQRRDADGMEVDSEVPMPPMFGVHLELFDMDVDPARPHHLIASGARGAFPGGELEGSDQVGIIFESWDAGSTWSILRRVSKSDYFDSPVTGAIIDRVVPNRLITSTRSGVMVSEAGGAAGTWAFMNEGLGTMDRFSRSLAVDDDLPNRVFLATAQSGLWVRDTSPTPVRLASFAVDAAVDAVTLRWSVASAEDHAGFHVDRVSGSVTERLTGRLLSGRADYEFVDRTAVPGRSFRYDLIEVDRTGRESVVASREVMVPVGPALLLGPARPNPARGEARLTLTLSEPGTVRARVIDVSGRVVATLVDGLFPAGNHELAWKPADSPEGAVSGIYFIQAERGTVRVVQKVLLLP